MNQGRIWCVVNPTVGLPLFLGGVATISLLVHASVLGNTTWMSGYWQGAAPRSAENSTVPAPAVAAIPSAAGFTISVAPVQSENGNGGTAFVVTVTPPAGAIAPAAATESVPRPDTSRVAAIGDLPTR